MGNPVSAKVTCVWRLLDFRVFLPVFPIGNTSKCYSFRPNLHLQTIAFLKKAVARRCKFTGVKMKKRPTRRRGGYIGKRGVFGQKVGLQPTPPLMFSVGWGLNWFEKCSKLEQKDHNCSAIVQ